MVIPSQNKAVNWKANFRLLQIRQQLNLADDSLRNAQRKSYLVTNEKMKKIVFGHNKKMKK